MHAISWYCLFLIFCQMCNLNQYFVSCRDPNSFCIMQFASVLSCMPYYPWFKVTVPFANYILILFTHALMLVYISFKNFIVLKYSVIHKILQVWIRDILFWASLHLLFKSYVYWFRTRPKFNILLLTIAFLWIIARYSQHTVSRKCLVSINTITKF